MYGMIHNAVRDLVLEQHGPAVWDSVLADSGVGEDAFLAMQSYDDDVVLSLVQSTANTLGAPVSDCLEQFGIFWILHTAKNNYGSLLFGFGPTIWDLLKHLDHMHDRLSSSFPGYDAPSFILTHRSDARYELQYRSNRTGLVPFVIGLLKGLSVLFETPLRISLIKNETDHQGQFCVFLLD